jgi:hypothetical protein
LFLVLPGPLPGAAKALNPVRMLQVHLARGMPVREARREGKSQRQGLRHASSSGSCEIMMGAAFRLRDTCGPAGQLENREENLKILSKY